MRQTEAARVAAIPEPEALYAALVDSNGTMANMVYRRLNRDQLEAVAAFGDTQPPLPCSNVNMVAADARRELRRR